MKHTFYKYQSMGNDFILLDWLDLSEKEIQTRLSAPKWSGFVRFLCAHHFGVGADGVIIVCTSMQAQAHCMIFNADGTQGEKCLNGLRSAAQFLCDHKFCPKEFSIEMSQSLIPCKLDENHIQIKIDHMNYRDLCEVTLDCHSIKGHRVEMGNPHFVVLEKTSFDWLKENGQAIETDHIFPDRTNVEFVWLDEKTSLKKQLSVYSMLTFERGCGMTLACGSGAAAAMEVLLKLEKIAVNQKVLISMLGGELLSYFETPEILVQQGEAQYVFQGSFVFQ